ncbi:MAG: hypothetical protein Q9163_001407 [Psora crenata]
MTKPVPIIGVRGCLQRIRSDSGNGPPPGVELEEAGEKWRAGDAAKSLRFFVKAIDITRHPDPAAAPLILSRARLQLDVCQQPRLFEQLPNALVDLLRTAAESHSYALTLDSGNAENIFNSAQAYSSLAEALLDHIDDAGSEKAEALSLFHESLGLMEKCLTIQESQYEHAHPFSLQQPQISEQADLNPSPSGGSVPGDVTEEEVWASIVEPVTANTLLETILVELDLLETLCGLYSTEHTGELARIDQFFRHQLTNKIAKYGQGAKSTGGAAVAKASFLCSFAIARYRLGISDLYTCDRDFNASVRDVDECIWNDAQALCAIAEAHIDFNSIIEERLSHEANLPSLEDLTCACTIRWRHITRALDQYSAASKLPHAQRLARIHISRGDCEMLRMRLSEAPFNFPLAQKSEKTLAKNASVYYGAAIKVLSYDLASSDSQDDRLEVEAKMAVVASWLADYPEPLKVCLCSNKPEMWQRLEDMQGQGLLGKKIWGQLEELHKQRCGK